MFSAENSRENQNNFFVQQLFFFLLNSCQIYEIMWKNIVQPDRPQMAIWRMRIACWLPTATNTYIYVFLATIVVRTRLNVTYTYLACFVHHIISEQQHRDVFWANWRVI
jgi:hypothetical protein